MPSRVGCHDVDAIASAAGRPEASAWHGIGAPKNMPAGIIAKLNADINAALASSAVKSHFADIGASVVGGSPADFGNFIARQTDKWAKVVKFAGFKPD